MTENVSQIATLLSQAGAAHHEYEQNILKGEFDQNWSTWYSEYIMHHGLSDLLDAKITAAQLSQFLIQSNESHKNKNSKQSWAEYTAQKTLHQQRRLLGRNDRRL